MLGDPADRCSWQDIKDWWGSDDGDDFRDFMGGVRDELIDMADPANWIKSGISFVKNPINDTLMILRSPFDSGSKLIKSVLCRDYYGAGRAYTQLTTIQATSAFAGPALVDGLIPPRVSNPLARSGLTPRMQDAIRRAIQDEGGDVSFAVRERPIGADILDDLGVDGKPMNLKNVTDRGPNGARYGALIDDATGIQNWYVSDLDAAFFLKDGQMMTNFTDKSGLGRKINTYYGKNIVMHGDHMTGLWNKIKGVSPDYLIDEVYVFGSSGFVEAGSMHEMFTKYMQIK